MNAMIRWMAHHGVAANLLMLLFMVGGLVVGLNIKQEVFPEIALDKIQVSVTYPGAAPEEVEEGVLLIIEENVSGLEGIKKMTSQAVEGRGVVTVELLPGVDPDVALQDVKAEVDRIDTLPEEAEKPVITKMVNRVEVISLVVYGQTSERSLRETAEMVRDELLATPRITQAELGGVRPYEIAIEITEENLRRFGLTLESVAQRVRHAALDLPGGEIRTQGGEILLRLKERRYHGRDFEDIVILRTPEGAQVRLSDVASIRDGFEQTDEFALFDGLPAAMVTIYRVGDQKPGEIARAVLDYVAAKGPALPPTIHLATWNDTSELLQSRIDLLLKNALLGLTLVFLGLSLFLAMRLALLVMLCIPVAFLGALFLMPGLGVTINMISLFAFILALGIVVDNAIVVGENAFGHRSRGLHPDQAAVLGASEVAGPIIFSALTTVAAFLPLLFVAGTMGKFIGAIPLVVIPVLTISLIQSLFILPAHLRKGLARQRKREYFLKRLQNRVGAGLERFVAGPYARLLGVALEYRYATVALALAALILSVGLVGGGKVMFRFMPEVEADVITATLQMPHGTPVEQTALVVEHLVRQAGVAVAEFDRNLLPDHPTGGTVMRHIYALVGAHQIPGGGPQGASRISGGHLANVALQLQPGEERDVSSDVVARRWRELTGEVAGVESLTFKADLMRFGANIDVQLSHADFDVLIPAAERLKAALADYSGVSDIADNHAAGKEEITIRLRPEAATLGLTEEELGRRVRAAFHGAEALRLQRGRNEVKVMVRYPENRRASLADLDELRVRAPGGVELPLAMAAHLQQDRGYSAINRTDRKRVINVTATVDARAGNVQDILQELRRTVLADLTADHPGLGFDLEGEERERRESFGSMGQGFLMALFMIYALLAIPFRSYAQPLIVMAAIPFGIVGAIWGHMIMGINLSMLSIFGIVALSGVVVNSSLLLIDFINSGRRDGMTVRDAVMASGQRRFRPIILTSLTTFFGLMPMILERSVQAQFLIPMAVSLGFGVLFATGITLLLIPALYMVLEDWRGLMGLRDETA
ncbi:Multidrug efflux pump subunit AcrB [Desulfonatronum thiosulfatophilum]|uniref:Multidrug efflux pump subunit AcrB n=1 Tax=Desulfonatronum thiosulfatophilum TaxID=617002 RepID=A0A1G6DPY7_9BACT|nr:efflux RND transporter permease subunit [Desulfonatronum thiosulfatophilum]SDB47160.1 Multidrug efflux pump subunit AcrB [Desulfonatronum thiosulfatophilum]